MEAPSKARLPASHFGSGSSVIKFSAAAEGIERANTTDFSLAAAVWTDEIGEAHALADRVRSDTVLVNCHDHSRSRNGGTPAIRGEVCSQPGIRSPSPDFFVWDAMRA